jgi:aminomethyltransferase
LQTLRKTGLYDFHINNDAKMVPFAGYQMPLAYGNVGQGAATVGFEKHRINDLFLGASHAHVRTDAGLFDVGHMVQSKWVAFWLLHYYTAI